MPLLSRLAVQAARAYGMLVGGSPNNVPASYLVVAGGGGGAGGTAGGGGGGAGGFQTSTATLSTLNTYSITVGAGGNGGAINTIGSQGNNSVISGTGLTTITSTGGGFGGYGNVAAGAGGSGGGGGGRSTTNRFGGAGTSGQGNNGGDGLNDATNQSGAGGGGAGAVGGNASGSSTGGAGGNGLSSSISGSSVTYAGGGGGAGFFNTAYGTLSNGGLGGTGGGGTANSAGTANLGGGGGGGGGSAGGGGAGAGAAGGSGIVIISYASATPRFVGGTITTSGGNQIHTFTSSGTLSPITPITASYLVVAGGGGGGSRTGGGGGAGGLLTSSTTLYSGATYVVTVGGGGSGGIGSTGTNGASGSNSSVSGTGLTTLTAIGGGFGSGENIASAGNGGSGGGAAVGTSTVGTGTAGQGNNGGTSNPSFGAGGGGGAGAVGGNANASTAGVGGAGNSSSISGTSVTYAGGGGGGGGAAVGTGGAGGGGNGGTGTSVGSPGTNNLGGGGGGGSAAAGTGYNGGSGGSGVVIISYAGSQQFNGGLVTTSGGNTIHTFTSTGALTPLTNNLTNSLRFRSSASAYLNRTFSTNGTSQTKNSFSFWVKRGFLGVTSLLFEGYDGSSSNGGYIRFDSSDVLSYGFGGASVNLVSTTQVFRDPSAWYHIVIAVDTTQATASNRIKFYVNGSQVTTFGTANYPSQNATVQIFNSGYQSRIGRSNFGGGDNFDGYLAEINFIDGQALEPYFFGNNDANGVWKPIQYRGTYGTNGFYLNFSNTTSTTTLGFDSSPNGNNWTTNNISLTAGTTYDAMTDVPTNTSATTANYGVLNPLDRNSSVTVSQGNLTANSASINVGIRGTFGVSSGKWYYEGVVTARGGVQVDQIFGVALSTWDLGYVGSAAGVGYGGSGSIYSPLVAPPGVASFGINDIIGVAFDVDALTISFYKNNSLQGTYSLPGAGFYFVATSFQNSTQSINCGQRPFAYTPPTGFVALNTFNLPTPTILQGNRFMDATLYSGNNVGQVVVNQGQFRPDFLWIKVRTNTYDHTLADSVRGVSAFLASNTTAAEGTNSELTSFNTNGFTLGATGSMARNVSGQNYVAWQWQAGQGSTSSNTSGTITSTVSVNTTAGFSIVTFTSTGAAATVGHGLGVAPSMIIVKARNNVSGWPVYHASIGNTGALRLDQTAATSTTIDWWRNTSPTSSVFSIGANFPNAFTEVAYCWAEIAGFSRFGSYVGNGSSPGPFVYLGFRPEFIMAKSTSTNRNWIMFDATRSPFNTASARLFANTSGAESTNEQVLFLSNGFQMTTNTFDGNTNGETYIYMAFAEHPFKNANAR